VTSTDGVRLLLHITDHAAWERARADGEYRAPSLDTEGFIHGSTIEQLVDTANRFYAGRDDLVVVCVDEERIGVPVKYEPAATPPGVAAPGEAALFPHVYGPIKVEAVIGVVDLPPEPDGSFVLPRALARSRSAPTRPY
jgi:uncharacterized protein (DUF952 family)